MIRPLFLSTLVALAATLALRTPAAHACVPIPNYNAYGASDVIVAGRVTGWDVVGAQTAAGSSYPIAIHVAVDRVIKGSLNQPQVDIIDSRSLDRLDGPNMWTYSVWDCGDFQSDPTGDYLVFGVKYDDGVYKEAPEARFYQGSESTGFDYDRALARIERLKVEQGNSQFERIGLIGGVVAVVVLLLAVSFALRVRRKRGEVS